jgi:long-chain fatty acid transport protein
MRGHAFTVLAAWLAFVPAAVHGSGYEFDGVGARAVARGGAVTAAATDWTAIYWNPAGLAGGDRHVGVEARAGKMYSKDGNSFNVLGTNPFDKTRASSGFAFGSVGAVIPLTEDSALGTGIYTPLMQGSKFRDATSDPAVLADSLDYESSVLAAVGNISYARRLGERLSAGVGVNTLYGDLGSESDIHWTALAAFVPELASVANKTQRNVSDASGYGVEAVGGLRYAVNGDWAVGLVARSGATIKLKGEEELFLDGVSQDKSDFEYPVKHPATTAVGVLWRASDSLTLTFDCAQTWWKGFSSAMTYSKPSSFLANRANSYDWDNSVKFRLGALRRLSERYEAMAGYAFDTFAIDGGSVDFSTAIDVPMHRFSGAVTRKGDVFDGTLAALVGGGKRTSEGVEYSVWGWYVMGEGKYRF